MPELFPGQGDASDEFSGLDAVLVLLEERTEGVEVVEAVEVAAELLVHLPLGCHHVLGEGIWVNHMGGEG